MKLKNKVVWITGGARMGQTVAEVLAAKGCHIALSYKSSQKKAQQTIKALKKYSIQTLLLKGDMTKEREVIKCVRSIHNKFKKLDVLIHMASIYKKTPWKNLKSKEWHKIVDSNLTSSFLVAHHATPLLKKQKGRIIFFSDGTAKSGRPTNLGYSPYYTAKMGVMGLTQSLALELAPHVLVNAIAPGPILPPVSSPQSDVRNILKTTPLNRLGGSGEIAKGVLFFIQSDFVTGECLRIDGGRHLK